MWLCQQRESSESREMKRSAGCTVTHLTLSGSHDSRVTTHDSRLTPTHDSRVNRSHILTSQKRAHVEQTSTRLTRAVACRAPHPPVPTSPLPTRHSPDRRVLRGCILARWSSERMVQPSSGQSLPPPAPPLQQPSAGLHDIIGVYRRRTARYFDTQNQLRSESNDCDSRYR